MISDSEMQDFNAAITAAGFNPDDFNPIAVEDDPQGVEQHVNVGTVTVHRISSGISKTYRAGTLSTWCAEFEIDLNAGEFGQP